MSPKGAALVFRVDGVLGARSLTVSVENPAIDNENPAIVERQWDLSDGETDSVHEALRTALDDIHNIAGDDLEPTRAASDRAVNKLLTLANRVGWGLFRDTSLDDVQKADRFRCLAALDPARPPRVIEVSTPQDYGYPFELLPWHIVDRDIPDPALRARTLLGMSAIMRRRLRRVEEWSGPGFIENSKQLPVTVLQHPGLLTTRSTAPESEAHYLCRTKNLVEVYGWPRTAELEELAAVRHVLDSRRSLSGPSRTSPTAILHFACHCDTTSSISDNHKIDVGGKYGGILLGELKTYAFEPAAKSAAKPRPLVFLNACGSAKPRLASRVSFPEFFLDRKSLGVVCTLCDISNDVAAHFAAVFYEALLRGRTIGEAIYDARWHLMDRHRNPLGLLYTFYGNPDLKVTHPRRGEVIPACSQT